MSPAALDVAPDWVRWYVDQANGTRRDWFVLPPSGVLYAYPGMMPPDVQDRFVALTEAAAERLDTDATVSWEFIGTWPSALKKFYPKYAARGVVRSIFAVNVPYLFPVAPFGRSDDFIIVGDGVVVFRPNEVRGTSGGGPWTKPPNELAAEISAWPRGTVRALYVTSDGGEDLAAVYETIGALGDHVEVVDHRTLADMAFSRGPD